MIFAPPELAPRRPCIPMPRRDAAGPTFGPPCLAPASRSRLASRCPEIRGRRAEVRSCGSTTVAANATIPGSQRPGPASRLLVGLGRFERPTSRLSGVRSNQLSYRPMSELGEQRSEIRTAPRVLVAPCLLTADLRSLSSEPGRDAWTAAGVSVRGARSPDQTIAPSDRRPLTSDLGAAASRRALRKEVIQPQVPLRLPCYDFTPVADLTVDGYLPSEEGLAHRLRVKPTPMV